MMSMPERGEIARLFCNTCLLYVIWGAEGNGSLYKNHATPLECGVA